MLEFWYSERCTRQIKLMVIIATCILIYAASTVAQLGSVNVEDWDVLLGVGMDEDIRFEQRLLDSFLSVAPLLDGGDQRQVVVDAQIVKPFGDFFLRTRLDVDGVPVFILVGEHYAYFLFLCFFPFPSSP